MISIKYAVKKRNLQIPIALFPKKDAASGAPFRIPESGKTEARFAFPAMRRYSNITMVLHDPGYFTVDFAEGGGHSA